MPSRTTETSLRKFRCIGSEVWNSNNVGRRIAKAVVEVFGPDRPIASEHLLDAATSDPAADGLIQSRVKGRIEGRLPAGIDTGPRHTASSVKQPVVDGDTETPTHRRQPLDLGIEDALKSRGTCEAHRLVQTRPAAVGLDADNKLLVLRRDRRSERPRRRRCLRYCTSRKVDSPTPLASRHCQRPW